MIDARSLSYRSVCPCRSVAKKQVGKHASFTSRGSVSTPCRFRGVSKGFSLCHVGLKPNLNFTPILISRMPGSIPAKQPQAISRPVPHPDPWSQRHPPRDRLVSRTVARITMGRRSAPDGSRSYQSRAYRGGPEHQTPAMSATRRSDLVRSRLAAILGILPG